MGTGAMLVLCFCAALQAQRVQYDRDKSADFSQFHTFSWAKLSTPDNAWNDRVQMAVDNALEARGLRLVPSGGDLELSALVTTRQQHELDTFYNGGWGWWGPAWVTAVPRTFPVGTLVVDLYSAKGKQLVWRSDATDTFSETDPIKNDNKIDAAAKKMFAHYPKRKHA